MDEEGSDAGYLAEYRAVIDPLGRIDDQRRAARGGDSPIEIREDGRIRPDRSGLTVATIFCCVSVSAEMGERITTPAFDRSPELSRITRPHHRLADRRQD